MQRFLSRLLALLLLPSLTSCLPTPAPLSPLPTLTLAPTQIPTPTIVWFPPTATFTPLPSPTPGSVPTLDARVQHGKAILQDNFTNSNLWTSGKSATGSVAFGEGELSLGIAQPQGYLFSLRQDISLADFYLEITASPSICRGKDEYGVLFRISNPLDFFRFGLNCSGEARLDRLLSGIATSPQPLILSGAVPPGAPSSSRVGIWASGKDMRFYVNGEILFSIRDASLLSGGVGVYARAAGTDAMTINFSDLRVFEIQP